ncbi:MAG TPA: secretin N-terminal domain-containing protein [Candidatus Didemnitutus sp.]|nr:secretin N-terminal domain-containing protein [Candidatus Didemnitutus sp.]
MSTRIVLIAIAALGFTAQGLAQPAAAPAATPPPADAPKADAVTVQPAAPTTTAAVTRDKDTLSVDFPDEEIKTILRNVADLFELNLVVPDTLTGKTSIKLRDVTWRQIFHVVLSPAGYTYIEEGNIIKVVSNESLTQEPASTEVFVLNNAKAADIKPTVDGLVDAAAGGKILVDARSNALIVTERPSKMGRIRTIIDQLDKATDQVLIESKFIEVTDGDIRNLGVNWSSLSGYQLTAGPFTGGYTRQQDNNLTNQNVGQNTNVPFMQNQQVLAGQVVGSNGPLLPAPTQVPDLVNGGYVNTYPGVGGTTTLTQMVDELVQHEATAVFSAPQFNVLLSALNTLDNTKVVSNPTVVTLNNTEATLNVGEEFPIPSYTYNSERGQFEVSGFQYKAIGVNMKVTPQVNARGIIKLTLEPEVSQQNGQTSFGGAGGASIPIIATRKAKTQVSLKSGETMGIGGLVSTNKHHSGTKVPVLGDIPLLGRVFSSKSVDDTTSNLLIFITAKTLSADGAPPEEVFDPRAIQALGMGRDELPGYRAPKGSDPFAAAPAKEDK